RSHVNDPDSPVGLLVAAFAASVVGSVFAAGEGALVSLPEPRLQAYAKDPKKLAIFGRYLANRQRVLARWLVCRIAATSFSAVCFERVADVYTDSLAIRILAPVLLTIATYGTFAEITLTLARRRAEAVGALALRVLLPLEWAVAPFAEPLARLGRFIGRRFVPRVLPAPGENEVEWAVAQGEKAGSISPEPAEMIRNVLELPDQITRDVMIPRLRIVGIEVGTTLEETIAIVSNEGHSRFPIYEGTLDTILGLLYAKDLFAIVKENRVTTTRLKDLVRPQLLFVVETQPLLGILREMRARHLHMAVVSDEFGGTSGLVTLEDVIEEIVGEINDEHDVDDGAKIRDIGEGKLVADAAVPLTEISARLGHEFDDGDSESLGGLLVHRAGKVPEVGDKLTLDGFTFIVREANETRVVKVEIDTARVQSVA
ncbi:MAG: hemolysin family protein, partial [Polyangiaceae bacterium]